MKQRYFFTKITLIDSLSYQTMSLSRISATTDATDIPTTVTFGMMCIGCDFTGVYISSVIYRPTIVMFGTARVSA